MESVLPGDGAVRKDWAFLSKETARWVRTCSANRVFVDSSVKLKPDYVDAVGRSAVAEAPFRSDRAAAVQLLNAWVERRTENRIKGLLRPDMLAENTSLVLVNSLYIRVFWKNKFKKEETRKRLFVREDGSSSKVPMMKQDVFTEGVMEGGKYYEKDGVRGVSLFLKGGKDAPVFVAVLPPDGKKLKGFVEEMTADEWIGILAALSARDSDEALAEARKKSPDSFAACCLELPRFSQSSRAVSLKNALISLGMKDAFTTRADFSLLGDDPLGPLKVDDVYQKCVIRVEEKGMEVAAVSGIEMDPFGSPAREPGPVVEFNRPFLWLVYSPADHAVLFAGTYEGPPVGP